MLENERYRMWPALVRGVRIGDAGERKFAELLDDLRSPGLQNRIGVVADQLVVVAHTVLERGDAGEPLKPLGRCCPRDRFVTGPGPEAGGSNQGRDGCAHTREKSGIDATVSFALLAAGTAVCAGADVAATNVANSSNAHCIVMPPPIYLSSFKNPACPRAARLRLFSGTTGCFPRKPVPATWWGQCQRFHKSWSRSMAS
jgi:hypothetical protein